MQILKIWLLRLLAFDLDRIAARSRFRFWAPAPAPAPDLCIAKYIQEQLNSVCKHVLLNENFRNPKYTMATLMGSRFFILQVANLPLSPFTRIGRSIQFLNQFSVLFFPFWPAPLLGILSLSPFPYRRYPLLVVPECFSHRSLFAQCCQPWRCARGRPEKSGKRGEIRDSLVGSPVELDRIYERWPPIDKKNDLLDAKFVAHHFLYMMSPRKPMGANNVELPEKTI